MTYAMSGNKLDDALHTMCACWKASSGSSDCCGMGSMVSCPYVGLCGHYDDICAAHVKIYSKFMSHSAQLRLQSHQTMSAQLYLFRGMLNGQVTKPM